jgi:thioredoxin-related protein
MRRIFLLLGILVFSLTANAQQEPNSPNGIKFFDGSWQDALTAAKKQKKYIFIDGYTSWCGPCKHMAREIFPQKSVGDFYNANFIAYKMNMEQGEGPAFAKKYSVQYYPTFLYFSPDGKLVHEAVGGRNAMEFISVGQDALDSNHTVFTLLNRFKRGKYDVASLKELLPKLQYINDSASKEVLNTYWKTQTPLTKLAGAENWEIFKNYERDILSPQFQYVSAHKQDFSSTFGTEVVDKVLNGKVAEAMDNAAQTGDSVTFKAAYKILSKSDDPDILKYAAYSKTMYFKQLNQWDSFANNADRYATKYSDDASGLNEMAWAAFKGTKDVSILDRAVKWAKASVDADKQYANMDTYANLLYLTHQYKEAEAAANEAIGLGQSQKEAVGATQELLDKIKQAKK